jgi:hypothetical protein
MVAGATNWQFELVHDPKMWYRRQGFVLAGTRTRKCNPSSLVITSGVFQSMDAHRFGTAAAAWLIKGRNRATIGAPWADAGVRTVVQSFGFWCLPGGPLPGGSTGSRMDHGGCLREGGPGGAWDGPGGGPLLQICSWRMSKTVHRAKAMAHDPSPLWSKKAWASRCAFQVKAAQLTGV